MSICKRAHAQWCSGDSGVRGFTGTGPLRLSGQFTGTMPIQEHQRFDVGALEGYLRKHGFSGPLTIEQFKGGQSNPTYLIEAAGERHVLRAKPGPAAKLLPSAHAVEREFRVIT